MQRVAKEVLTLLEDAPMNELDGFAEGIVTQTAQQADNDRQDNEKGVLADTERTLQ